MKKITEKRLNDNNSIGSSFNDFLIEEGISEEVEAGAIKKINEKRLAEIKAFENSDKVITRITDKRYSE